MNISGITGVSAQVTQHAQESNQCITPRASENSAQVGQLTPPMSHATDQNISIKTDSFSPLSQPTSGHKSQYDANVILLMSNELGDLDPTSKNAAYHLLNKHPDNSCLVIAKPDGSFSSATFEQHSDGSIQVKYLNDNTDQMDISQAHGKARLNIVMHGDQLAKKEVNELANLVKNITDEAGESFSLSSGKVGLVACGDALSSKSQAGTPYGAALTESLHKLGIDTTVTQRVKKVAVTSDGHKFTENDGKGIHKVDQSKMNFLWTREGVVAKPVSYDDSISKLADKEATELEWLDKISRKGGGKFVEGKNNVPESCIESAEFIIRVTNADSSEKVVWDGAGSGDGAPVFLVFGNCYINISETGDIQNLDGLTDATNYEFDGLPELGEGLGILNTSGMDIDGGYNMHFGAVVKESVGSVEISDMQEPSDREVGSAKLETMDISSVDDFRGDDYPSGNFAIGLLTMTEPTDLTELTN